MLDNFIAVGKRFFVNYEGDVLEINKTGDIRPVEYGELNKDLYTDLPFNTSVQSVWGRAFIPNKNDRVYKFIVPLDKDFSNLSIDNFVWVSYEGFKRWKHCGHMCSLQNCEDLKLFSRKELSQLHFLLESRMWGKKAVLLPLSEKMSKLNELAINGLSTREIAIECDIPQNKVCTYLKRIRDAVRGSNDKPKDKLTTIAIDNIYNGRLQYEMFVLIANWLHELGQLNNIEYVGNKVESMDSINNIYEFMISLETDI